ncbi:MAG TPA: response regulator [Blastocatellia bacterium]|nr:response regulator [Blastocatellia bacterium]
MDTLKGKVLIVDDEEAIRIVLSEALRLWGYETVEAENVASARAVFVREAPVAVITDVNLPDGSGLDLLREFKRRNPPPAVIVVTGDIVIENTISALRGHADDFISKPININELQLALNNSLAKQNPNASPPPFGKLRILVVADTESKLKAIRSVFNPAEAEITTAQTASDLAQACLEPHEMVAVDLEPSALESALRTLRTNELHENVPLLVSSAPLIGQIGLAGLLPKYRAMQCSPAEMAALVVRRIQSMGGAAPSRSTF